MKCPTCNAKAGCLDSRWRFIQGTTYRRYRCKSEACGVRFSTAEKFVDYELGRPVKQEKETSFETEARLFAQRIKV